METLDRTNPNQLSPLTLAFIGDAVYELLVRERLVNEANRQSKKLHSESVKLVNAAAQSQAAEKLLPLLTEEETAVYRRGKNAHVAHFPKGATAMQYNMATGLESLFGWLYLCGKADRINELFSEITGTKAGECDA